MSEEEITVLMAKEITEEICKAVGNTDRPKCRAILHRILSEGLKEEYLEKLLELPEEVRRIIREKLKELGVE